MPLAATASPDALPPEPAQAPSGRADLVRSLFTYTPVSLASHLLGAAVVVVVMRGVVPDERLWAWCVVFGLLWIARLALAFAFARRKHPTPQAAWPRWQAAWNTLTLLAAALWGLAAWWFYGWGDALQKTALLMVIFSYCAGAVPLLVGQQRIFLAFASLCFLPSVAAMLLQPSTSDRGLALVMVLIFGLTLLLGRNYQRAFHRVIELKARTDHLLVRLQQEKAAAEAARREAEVANRAKTQFFAAASHDLRQPLHALGLFAEALRGKSQDEEVVQLVASINDSVDALEGLFSELLDITRIDSGGVQVSPRHVSMQEVFRRLRLHFEPTAFEKGLALRFRGGRQAAHADPVLLERILRNLLANAIRYTDDGGVLVAARRRGDRLLLQVWDSGRGIAPADQERIFEEFFQVAPHEVAADQRKGLGLGLAIVQRLARLIEAPLSLRSAPGRGSVFGVSVPVGRMAGVHPRPRPPARRGGPTLAGRCIVMVEDDLAVRSGLEVLLKGWGAQLHSFDGLPALRTWLADRAPDAPPPDLLIADYRLGQQDSGLDAIRLLRAAVGPALPAVVVTGSVMSHLEQEAQAEDFHLLMKPVAPNRLRAMINFKLERR
jgi:signal transduction histidine kinase